ncbi:Branched-chain-amino-acid aminotransferase [Ewingella americana]|uniref:Branched-chain-amino-acid aminotransferase n=1 Tax=Ewingella americana TaxID=41202 RepID=A0A377NJ28_9GAMM|nr:Branched-chain-amino-acid aminotransferase [Ewingella americana]
MTKKADFIWFNGEMVPWAEAKVHVMSHALHYGTSVFEGVRCYDSHKGPVVFRHREHMQRLRDSAKIYRMPVSQSVDELMEACRENPAHQQAGERIHPSAGVYRRCRYGR